MYVCMYVRQKGKSRRKKKDENKDNPRTTTAKIKERRMEVKENGVRESGRVSGRVREKEWESRMNRMRLGRG